MRGKIIPFKKNRSVKPLTVTEQKTVEGGERGKGKGVSFRLVGHLERTIIRRFPFLGEIPENPWIPVAIVLLSAEILKTTDVDRLVRFTGYSRNFIAAVALNLIQNEIWSGCGRVGGRRPKWFSSDWTITNDGEFFQLIQFACGDQWTPEAGHIVTLDPCKIFDDDKSSRN